MSFIISMAVMEACNLWYLWGCGWWGCGVVVGVVVWLWCGCWRGCGVVVVWL